MGKEQAKTLITGSSGFVASQVARSFRERGGQTLAPSHQELDITSQESVFDYFGENKPGTVINFAAVSGISNTELERKNRNGVAWRTNVDGVRNIAKACQQADAFLIQISSVAVFPGTEQNPGPYSETDIPPGKPRELNWYGLSKLEAERITNDANGAIVRMDIVFGNPKSEKDHVIRIIKRIRAGYTIFNDQSITPTFIPDLTSALWQIKLKRLDGIFHVACEGVVSRIDFAHHIAEKIDWQESLVEGLIIEFSRGTRTPMVQFGGLKTERTQERLGVSFYHWQEAVDSLDL